MADEQPGAGEDFLEFLLVDFFVRENLAADQALAQVDHGVVAGFGGDGDHGSLSLEDSGETFAEDFLAFESNGFGGAA
jgi:hypothetical protein